MKFRPRLHFYECFAQARQFAQLRAWNIDSVFRIAKIVVIVLCFANLVSAEVDVVEVVESGDLELLNKTIDRHQLDLTEKQFRRVLGIVKSSNCRPRQLLVAQKLFDARGLQTLEFTSAVYGKLNSKDEAVASVALEHTFHHTLYGPQLLAKQAKQLSKTRYWQLLRALKWSGEIECFRPAIEEMLLTLKSLDEKATLIDNYISNLTLKQILAFFESLYLRSRHLDAASVLSCLPDLVLLEDNEPKSKEKAIIKLFDKLFRDFGPDLNEVYRHAVLEVAGQELFVIKQFKAKRIRAIAWKNLCEDPLPYAGANYLQSYSPTPEERSKLVQQIKARVRQKIERGIELLPIITYLQPIDSDFSELYQACFDVCVGRSSRFDLIIVSNYWRNEPDFYYRAIEKLLAIDSIYTVEGVMKSLDLNYPRKLPTKFLKLLQLTGNLDNFKGRRIKKYLNARAEKSK